MDAKELKITSDGVRGLLESGYVSGIGPVYARRLVEAYGVGALNVLAEDPAKVAAAIAGLGEERALRASQSVREMAQDVGLMAFLFSCGVAPLMIDRILGKYRTKARNMVVDNPYGMVEDVWGLGFRTADRIGLGLGTGRDDKARLGAALVTAVKDYARDGHLFATVDQAVVRAASMAGVDADSVRRAVDLPVNEGRLIMSRGGLYLPVYYNAEKESARRLAQMARLPVEPVDAASIPDGALDGTVYTPGQKDAVLKALNSRVMVLTGGPGTGKTTVLRGVMDVLEAQGKKVVLAAPTGRAVKRMEQATGRPASTIHRLLGYREGRGYNKRRLDADVLVIDEGSMMEQVLLDHLLDAVGPDTRLLLVGDVDQLPAIGAGDVMRQMIDSEVVPVSRLEHNFRQCEGGGIALGARDINMGRLPGSVADNDLLLISEEGVKAIHDRILGLVAEELPRLRGLRPQDIVVVTPQQIGPLGARQLNIDLQESLNPSGPEIRRGQTVLRVGDPVMQTANSGARGIYNGETGVVTAVDVTARTVTVTFSEGRQSVYGRGELSELVLAYATTVHKLQGCEVRNMVLPVTMAHRPMLYRNLLYTAVSRASRLCVLVGEQEALRHAAENVSHAGRNSNFAARLQETMVI